MLRYLDALRSAMQSVLDQVMTEDAKCFFNHCGYAPEIIELDSVAQAPV